MPARSSGALDSEVSARVDAAVAIHPALARHADALTARLTELSAAGRDLPPRAHAGDLLLAVACAAGDAAAHAAFCEALDPVLVRALERVDPRPHFVADAAQTVRERLLVGGDAGPRIVEYAGRAPLRAFLRAVAVRTAISLRRRRAEGEHEELASHRHAAGLSQSPEVQYLKARYKDEFERSLRAAMESLTPRERALLRLSLVEGLSIDVVGARYRVGRSTAARWIAAARAALTA
ncbi:MAG TPA: sigma-70 family RNA polymerase sigma factor, partial [Byssovorax sp.]